MNGADISKEAFTDDVMLIAGSKRELQENFNIWNSVLEEHGSETNKTWTQVMVVSDSTEDLKQIRGTIIEQVTAFQNLGIAINEQAS